MHKFLIEETPAKVFSLLGVALFSMAFLFSVSTSEASFAKVYNPLPNPFSPENVLAVIDNTAAGYSNFLAQNLIEPAKADYGFYFENVAWIWDNSKADLAYAVGLDGVGESAQTVSGKVAGAYTSVVEEGRGGFSIDTVYSMLLQ
jgi:hypothetical protein